VERAAGHDADELDSRGDAGRLIDAGADALDAGEVERALGLFSRAATSDLPSLAGRGAIGAAEALVRLGRDGEAVGLLEGAAESDDREIRYVARRRLAALLVTTGSLKRALGEYRRAEQDAPTDAARAEIAARIGWLTKETGGSRLRSRLAFSRARGGGRERALPLAMVGVTAFVSVAALAAPSLLEALALIKLDPGRGDLLTLEPWRLLTAALVHGSPLHLLFNLFAMDLGARLVQRLYGPRRLVLWYLLGVVAASLASSIWSPFTASVGASGGVFALFGIALGAEWAHRPLVERGVRAALGQIGGLILVNLLFGLGTSVVGGGIDNAAHLGGLVFGLLLGVGVAPTRAESMRSRWSSFAASPAREGIVTIAVCVLLVVIFANWFSLAQLRVQLPI